MADQLPEIGTPRWVKVSGIIGAVLVLLVVFMIFIGHGPQRHTSPSSVTDIAGDHAPSGGDRR